jgi:transposase
MTPHLAEIAKAVAPFVGKMIHRIIFWSSSPHAVLVLDGAGWHGGRDLVVPDNLTLLTLPPPDQVRGRLYAPELNPVENIWEFLRKNALANRLYRDYRHIVDACCGAWNDLVDNPQRIASIATRHWAKVS